MHVNIETGWATVLKKEFEQPYFEKLMEFVEMEYKSQICFPPEPNIFSAFSQTPFDRVKVVIIGQDPYHGIGQAHGLCFSVAEGVKLPPSLKNIFKELASDIGIPFPLSGNLNHWAKQGVLLLNATLTVREKQAGSHQNKGWEKFTDAVITKISEDREGLVFMLWGGKAQKSGSKINLEKHLVLTSGHPSPLSANKGHWFGNKHFSKANDYLKENGKEPINWYIRNKIK